VYALECRRVQEQLADMSTELSACHSQLSELTDQQRRYDNLIATRDETIHQLSSDLHLLQQRVNIASPNFTIQAMQLCLSSFSIDNHYGCRN